MKSSSQLGSTRDSGLREAVRKPTDESAQAAARAEAELRVARVALALLGRMADAEATGVRPFREVTRAFAEVFGDFSSLRLLSPDGAWLEIAGMYPDPALGEPRDASGPEPPRPQSSAQQGVAAEVVREGLAKRVHRDELMHGHDGDRELAERFSLRGMLIVPIRSRDAVLGTLLVARSSDQPFTDDELELVSELAEQAVAPLVLTEQRQRDDRATREKVALVACATGLLAQSLDYEQTLANVAAVVAPQFADFVLLDVREPDGMRRLARAPSDEAAEQLLGATAVGETPVNASEGASLTTDVDDRWLARIARDGQQLAKLRGLAIRTAVEVPLRYRNEDLGTLTLAFGPSQREHGEDDLALADEIARRAAVAIMNARLFKEAREAIGVRDDFLSMAGHELRTPLTALQLQILSITKMLGQDDSAEKIAARAEKASRNVLRLSNLVNELLDVSRITAGRLKLERGPVDLGGCVREVVARHAEELEKNGCPVQLSIASDVVGDWDVMRIEQIVTSLLANAIKYGKGNPIELRVETGAEGARLIVRDHGIGIPIEDQQRIFQRFERAVSSRHFGGLGFGLWIARQLVDAHGGTIRVNSEAGEGATFEVDLPLARSDEAEA